MIPEMLHPVRAGRSTRPVTLKLALAAAAVLFATTATEAQAQFDSGGYTSADTPGARAHQSQEQTQQAQQRGLIPSATALGPVPELQVFAAVSLAETYTSNASGSVGNSHDDFYTQPGIRLGFNEQTRRLTASGDYSLTGQYYARDHDFDQLVHRLNAMANAELLEQTLFMDAQAFAQPASLTRAGALTAADGTPTNNNYRDTYGFVVRPTLMHQFGNVVETDLWFSQSGIYFVTPNSANTVALPGFFRQPSNSNTSSVGARISSLDDFVRLRWSINGSASDTYQPSHISQKVRSATANVSYAVTNSVALIATGGYQVFHSSYLLNKDLDGPTLLGGLQFTPSPDFSFYVQAGTQNNFPTYIGSLQWSLSPLTTITASANDQVQTPQQQLLGNLQNPTGLASPGGGLPGNPPPSPGINTPSGFLGDGLSIDNSVYRYRRFNFDVQRSTERTNYGIAVYATLRDRLNDLPFNFLNTHEKTYGISAIVQRHLRRDLVGGLTFTASRADEFNGNDRILEGDVRLNYLASETLSFNALASVLQSRSDNLVGFSNGDRTDVRVTVGVTKSF